MEVRIEELASVHVLRLPGAGPNGETCSVSGDRVVLQQVKASFDRVAELEAEVKAWRFRFPNLAFTNRLDGIQSKP